MVMAALAPGGRRRARSRGEGRRAAEGRPAACERSTRKAPRVCRSAAHAVPALSLVEGSKGVLYQSREAEEVYLPVAGRGEVMPGESPIKGVTEP